MAPSGPRRPPRSPTTSTCCWPSATTPPSTGSTCAPPTRSSPPSPPSGFASESPRAPATAPPVSRWRSSSSNQRRPGGGPSTHPTSSRWSVTELAQELGMTQPGASKHLRVLRAVGLVRDRKAGKQRLYGLDARGLRPVHEWTGGFERFWNESFGRLDEYVQDLRQARQEE